jgi:hypothetical protein
VNTFCKKHIHFIFGQTLLVIPATVFSANVALGKVTAGIVIAGARSDSPVLFD